VGGGGEKTPTWMRLKFRRRGELHEYIGTYIDQAATPYKLNVVCDPQRRFLDIRQNYCRGFFLRFLTNLSSVDPKPYVVLVFLHIVHFGAVLL